MPRKTISPQDKSQFLLWAVLAGAIGLGVFARLKGLGAAPLAVDEYFIVRSMQNVLHHGWPTFDCGGIYSRGVLLQYPAALLNLLGMRSDIAPRFIAAVTSLAALPAAYILGRRARGPTVGILAVVVLALSVWEIEMARFGRMYAPFQAVVLWYLVFFLRRTVDGDARADWPMIILTLVGGLLWEGGVFLGLANFMPLFLQRRSLNLSRREWLSLIKFVPVFLAVYWFVTTDFRMLDSSPALPLDYADADDHVPDDPLTAGASLWSTLGAHRIWMVGWCVLLVAGGGSLFALWRRRETPLMLAAFVVTLAAALAHQFVAAAAIWVAIPLFRFGTWAQLATRGAQALYAVIGACALFWLALRGQSWHPPPEIGVGKATFSFLFPLVSMPNVFEQVVHPWARAVPMLGLGLLLLVGIGLIRVLRRDEPGVSAERALHAVLFCLLLAMCATPTPRYETRYVFFLYPVAAILALAVIVELLDGISARGRAAAAVAPILCLGLFMLSEDFQPRHLFKIDRPEAIFRRDIPRQEGHLVARDDTRALAQWLERNVAAGGRVINAYQSLDYYDPKVDFFYVDRNDFNFASYACDYGTIDRWSNRPLVQSVEGLTSVISSGRKTYLVTYSTRLPALLPQLLRYHPTVAWSEGSLSVVEFTV
jgi:hypothetical protein